MVLKKVAALAEAPGVVVLVSMPAFGSILASLSFVVIAFLAHALRIVLFINMHSLCNKFSMTCQQYEFVVLFTVSSYVKNDTRRRLLMLLRFLDNYLGVHFLGTLIC